jgi:hypothetical protein
LISVKDWYFFLLYIILPSHLTLQLNENEIQIYKKDDSTYFMTGIYLQSKLHCLVRIHWPVKKVMLISTENIKTYTVNFYNVDGSVIKKTVSIYGIDNVQVE